MSKYNYTSGLRDCFIQFIEYKKSSGRKENLYVNTLRIFDNYCVDHQNTTLQLDKDTVDGFLQITDQRKFSSVLVYASVLRELGRYMHRIGMKESYITKLQGNKKSTYIPYIFSKKQMISILNQANDFTFCYDSVSPNMRNVISCLFVMLYCTGMRISEILSLKLSDVSLSKKTILIEKTKNGKQRLIPISNSLEVKCRDYLTKRSSLHNIYFFDSGARLHDGKIDKGAAYRYFRKLLEIVDIAHLGRGNGPRLHDIRDTFAVHSLQQLIELGGDVNAKLEYLSLYMGHHSIYETQDYLWLTEELATDMLKKDSNNSVFFTNEYRKKVVINDA